MVLTRRAFAGGAAAWTGLFLDLVSLASVQSAHAQTATEKPVSFRWRVPTAHYQTIENALVFDGSVEEERDTKGLPLVAVFIGVAMLPSLVDAISSHCAALPQPYPQPSIEVPAYGI